MKIEDLLPKNDILDIKYEQLKKSNDDWDNACKNCFKSENNDNQNEELQNFKKFVQDLLKVVSGDELAVADDTGFGDWSNQIDGQTFYADSGMVCVVEDTDKLEKYLNKNDIELPIGVAYVNIEDDATYQIDTSNPNWSVVKIKSRNKEIRSLGVKDFD